MSTNSLNLTWRLRKHRPACRHPGADPRAARVALDMLSEPIAQRRSFTLETTLAARAHLRTVAAQPLRVARRVAQGGHAAPDVDVRRRFARSTRNLLAYIDPTFRMRKPRRQLAAGEQTRGRL